MATAVRHDARRAGQRATWRLHCGPMAAGRGLRWRRSRHGCCRGDRARGRRVNELARRRFRVLPRTPREPRNVRGWRFQEALGAPWRMCSARRGRILAGGSRPSPGACDWSSVELYPCLGGVGRARRASGSKRASVSSSNRGRCRTAGGGGPGRQRRRSSFSRDEPSVRVDRSAAHWRVRARDSDAARTARVKLGLRCRSFPQAPKKVRKLRTIVNLGVPGRHRLISRGFGVLSPGDAHD